MAKLQSLTEYCEFGNFLEALRDWFVCGLSCVQIRKVLLTKRDLALQKALEIGLSIENAEHKNAIILEELHEKTEPAYKQ